MKKEFSKAWKASKQPRKQRKYLANAPLNIKRKMLSTNLSKELRKKQGKRNIVLIKGDTVKIMKGKFKKKTGKVASIKTKMLKVYVEGMQVKKMDGSKVNVALKASNLQIIELNMADKKRFKKTPLGVPQKSESGGKVEKTKTPEKKEEVKTESTKLKVEKAKDEGAPRGVPQKSELGGKK